MCGGSLNIGVDLRTDFAPLVEFTQIQVRVDTPDGELVEDVMARALNYTTGQRLTTFTGLKAGEYTVRAALLAEDGRRVGSRAVLARVNSSTDVTIVITRSCVGVVCPGAGDASLTECSGGRCVAPECSPETPQFCAEGCTANDDCASSVSCAEGACLAEGSCIFVGDDSACDSTEFCDTAMGCVPRPDLPDVGMPDLAPIDMGPEECGMPCPVEGRPCAVGTFDCTTGVPVCLETGAGNAGAVCRVAADLCDEDDMCDGVSAECPEEDTKKPAGEVCRVAVGECDVSEVCDGTSNACPVNEFRPVGTRCIDGGFCNGDNVCSDTCEPGASCNPEGEPCRTGVTDCSTGVPRCDVDGNQPNGSTCAATEIGSFGACGSFGGTCSESGTRSRSVTEFECSAGACVSNERTETEGCGRDTDGVACGSVNTGPYGACGGFSNTCDETGCSAGSNTSCTLTCPIGVSYTARCNDLPGGDGAVNITGPPGCSGCQSGAIDFIECSGSVVDGMDIDCSIDERC